MENENFKPDLSDEEYHFSETENAASAAFTDTSNKKSLLERIQRKNVIITILVIIAIIAIYKFSSVLFTSNSQTKPVQIPVNRQPVLATSKPAPAPTPVPQQAAVAAVNEKLNKINKMEADSEAVIEKLSAQVNELQNTITNLDTRLSTLANSVQDLVTQQQQEAAKKAAEAQQKKLVAKKVRAMPKPIYYVKALVPGRAWLATQDGGTITVGQGDNLPGYGTVVLIDPTQGTVTTNSGAILGYSPNDS